LKKVFDRLQFGCGAGQTWEATSGRRLGLRLKASLKVDVSDGEQRRIGLPV
jgi:hypothetical protein